MINALSDALFLRAGNSAFARPDDAQRNFNDIGKTTANASGSSKPESLI